MQLNLPLALEDLPLKSLTTIFKLLFTHWDEGRNRESISLLNDYIPEVIAEKKTAWHEASVEYSNEYRIVDRYTPRGTANTIKAKNKELSAKVSNAKRAYEKAQRVHELYKEAQQKYTF